MNPAPPPSALCAYRIARLLVADAYSGRVGHEHPAAAALRRAALRAAQQALDHGRVGHDQLGELERLIAQGKRSGSLDAERAARLEHHRCALAACCAGAAI